VPLALARRTGLTYMRSANLAAMTPRYPYAHVTVPASETELVSLELWELGATGVEERDAGTLNRPDADMRGGASPSVTLVASFEREDDARAAVEAFVDRFDAALRFVEGDDWREAYKAYFKPTRIGQRLVVKPSWEAFEPSPGDVVLTLDPGGAFGTGTHESTRLVLRALTPHLRPSMRVLDVGSGSGILSIACLLLGAEHALAIDVDPEAVRVGLENARSNGVAERFESSTASLDEVSERFPLVLANIESRVLVPMASALCQRLSPGGVLVLSGLLATERERVREAYGALELLEATVDGEWLSLVLRSPAS